MIPSRHSLTNFHHASLRFAADKPHVILGVVCSAMFLDLANLSAITIALPTIQNGFRVDQAQLQWTISAYALTFGSFLLIGGRGADAFGHRRVLLFGCTFFTLFTLICALSPTFVGLVIARAFQGIGAAFTIPSAQAHIALTFPDSKRKASALGIWAAAGSLGFIVGLILGGVLTNFLSWRWIFWVLLIPSSLLIPIAYLTLPRRTPSRGTISAHSAPLQAEITTPEPRYKTLTSIGERLTRFDAFGICLVVPGLLLLTYALASANVDGWRTGKIIATLIISVVVLGIFAYHEHRTEQALLPPRLFSVSFNLTLILALNTYAVRQAVTYFLTIQLQSYGNTPIHTAVLFIPLGISALVANSIAGRLVPILGARFMLILGWAFSIPGVLLFSFIGRDTSYWRFTFPAMVLYIAGIGAVLITANFSIVSGASAGDQGVVAGIYNVALQVGGSVLGLAVMTTVAQGINQRFGDASSTDVSSPLSEIAYRSVYYSCTILCGISLALSLFAVKVPDSMKGSIWKKTASSESRESGNMATPAPTTGQEQTEEIELEPIETTSGRGGLLVSTTVDAATGKQLHGSLAESSRHAMSSRPVTFR